MKFFCAINSKNSEILKTCACHFSKRQIMSTIKPSALQLPRMVHPEGNSDWRKTGYWPGVFKIPIKEVISVGLESCIFPFIEKH